MAIVHSTPVGVEGLVYATLTDETLLTYGAVTEISPLINIKVTPSVNADKLYADNRAVEVVNTIGEIAVEMEVQDLPLEVQAALLGHSLDATTGVMTYNSTDVAPYVALGFKMKKSNGKYRYVWLLKGKFEEYGEEAATQEDKASFNTPTISGTFVVRADGLWKYVYDEDSAVTPISNFLSTVYSATLDLVAPTVTTVPLDAATGVATDSNVVFTFDKAIQPATVVGSNFFLMKADGTAIPAALSIGTNNTVVTLNPTSVLDAGSYVAIATTNVKSTAGVSLAANCVVNFTV